MNILLTGVQTQGSEFQEESVIARLGSCPPIRASERSDDVFFG